MPPLLIVADDVERTGQSTSSGGGNGLHDRFIILKNGPGVLNKIETDPGQNIEKNVHSI